MKEPNSYAAFTPSKKVLRCNSTGNGLVVVGNADKYPGLLTDMPVNKLLEPFGLRATKTSGKETNGLTDIYCVGTPGAGAVAVLNALPNCTAAGGEDPASPPGLVLTTGPEGTYMLTQDVMGA